MRRLEHAAAQGRVLEELGHRPWPVPSSPWRMGQTWFRLLFAHWPVPAEALRHLVPEPLELEEWDGSAWIGVTPFRVTGLRLRGLPPFPIFSSFYELNCRTYVRVGARPGIWFFSLDASSRPAVEAARRFYKLPYHYARIRASSERFDLRRGEEVSFLSSYRGLGGAAPAKPGTLEYFLVERYCLYSDDGRLRADIHHPPWPLEPAEATVQQHGLAPVRLRGEPLLHYADRQDVVIWGPEAV
jgi:uncharacterized protein